MHELIYVSRATVNLDETEMNGFLGPSRRRNAANEITGLLMHIHDRAGDNAYYLQLLEGEEAAVEQTYRRISGDELHTDLSVVHRGFRERRSFADWEMRLTSLSTGAVLDLLAQEGHIDLAVLQDPLLARALLVLAAHQEH